MSHALSKNTYCISFGYLIFHLFSYESQIVIMLHVDIKEVHLKFSLTKLMVKNKALSLHFLERVESVQSWVNLRPAT